MLTRTNRASVTFYHPFELRGVDRLLPAGSYLVVTDEELIEGLSFPAYRRVATMIHVPAQAKGGAAIEMINIDPRDLEAAQRRDAASADTTP
jgi:hypothetical protein